jgi:hypothetical protein
MKGLTLLSLSCAPLYLWIYDANADDAGAHFDPKVVPICTVNGDFFSLLCYTLTKYDPSDIEVLSEIHLLHPCHSAFAVGGHRV